MCNVVLTEIALFLWLKSHKVNVSMFQYMYLTEGVCVLPYRWVHRVHPNLKMRSNVPAANAYSVYNLEGVGCVGGF